MLKYAFWHFIDYHSLILPTKKVRKISGFLTKFSDFGYCEPTKNFWIFFQKSGLLAAPKNWIQFFEIYLEKDFSLVGSSPDQVPDCCYCMVLLSDFG